MRAVRWGLLLAALLALLPGSALAVATLTGTAGSSINAQVTAPSSGDLINGSSIQVPLTSIVNDLATIKAGAYVTSATVLHSGIEVFSNQLDVSTAGILLNQGRYVNRPRVTLTDFAHTVDVTQADTFVLSNAPAAQRVITLSTVTGTPQVGERIRFVVPGLQASVAQPYQFTRTGGPAGLLAKINSSGVVAFVPVFVEFEFAAGLNLTVTGAVSGTGGAVKLTIGYTSGWGTLGNPTDGLATGDSVAVQGIVGTTEANGTWTITVNDGTHITLTGSTFVHAYTTGGTAQLGGTWRLGANSGNAYDGSVQYGVLPDGAS